MAESIALGLRLGTTAEHANFAGIEGEITINETEKRAVVHDGTTKGGFPMARLDETGYSLAKSSDGTKLQLKNKAGTVLSETDAPAGGGGSGVYVGNDAPTDASTDVWIDLDEAALGLVTSVNGKTPDSSGNVTITVGSDYTLPTATSSTLGGVTIGSNITVSSGKISLSSSNVTSALGFTPLSTTGTAAKATADASGNTITSTYAKLASPTFTGTPKAPTASTGTNTTQIATTAFVQAAISGMSSGGGIPLTGNRGLLAGYETSTSVESGTETINKNSHDVGATTVPIVVEDGAADESWTKVRLLVNSTGSLTLQLGSNWRWANSAQQTIGVTGFLVLHWNYVRGVVSYIPITL